MIELEHFRPEEFDRPDEIEDDVLIAVDKIRELSGIPLRISSDRRTQAEHEALYPDPTKRPNSPHVRGTSLDFQAMPPTAENKMRVLWAILDLWIRGEIPHELGLEIATRHFHIDVNDPELRRPHMWVGVSK